MVKFRIWIILNLIWWHIHIQWCHDLWGSSKLNWISTWLGHWMNLAHLRVELTLHGLLNWHAITNLLSLHHHRMLAGNQWILSVVLLLIEIAWRRLLNCCVFNDLLINLNYHTFFLGFFPKETTTTAATTEKEQTKDGNNCNRSFSWGWHVNHNVRVRVGNSVNVEFWREVNT